MLKNEEIIYVGNDWFADNRTSSHQIARLLAQHNRMLYVEAAGQRAPKASKRDIGKIFRKLKTAFADPVRLDNGMHLYSPVILPFHRFSLARRLNKIILGWSIKRACKTVGFENPVLWIILPHYSSLVDTVRRKGVVYYVVDEYSSMPDVDADRIREMERHVLDHADVVFTISEELTRAKSQVNPNTYFSNHGVDTAHFNRAHSEDLPRPSELGSMPAPVIGFFGLIEDWLDLELIEHLASRRPRYSFVLIGRVASDTARLKKHKNVFFLGQKKYEDIPAYLKYFDVCLIPFKLNEVIINSNPLKLKEYLAGGKPVVSVGIGEVRKYGDLVYIGDTYDEYLACVDRALEEDSPERARQRVRAMESESWPARVDVICDRVSKHIPGVHNE
jgi:glycosyltransferase involved in cell wall biosynthesis